MKIIQISAAYKPAYIYGGPTMSVAKLCEQLTAAGCQVQVFTTTANGNDELPVTPGHTSYIDGVKVTYFKRLTKDHSHFSPALLFRLWKTVPEVDVVHIHAWWNLVSVLATLVALIRKVPVVISPRGTLSHYTFNNRHYRLKDIFHKWIGKRLLKKAYLHATSVAENKFLSQKLQSQKIFTIANFVKVSSTEQTASAIASPVLKLLFLSRIEEKKGLDLLLEALSSVKHPYHLTVAGDGDKNYIAKLRQIARNNHGEANINWIGFQNESKFSVLQDHQLLVLPSHNENFGNVVIESLSVGTAVLVSEHVGLADYVAQNNFGWICATTPDSIANAINKIAENPQELARIRQSSASIIHDNFNEERLVEKYLTMYREIITHTL